MSSKHWFDQSTTPKPCPRCGKLPKLMERWSDEGANRGFPSYLVTHWYACRRWFGLRLCHKGPEHTNVKDWADLARRCAAQKWNSSVV